MFCLLVTAARGETAVVISMPTRMWQQQKETDHKEPKTIEASSIAGAHIFLIAAFMLWRTQNIRSYSKQLPPFHLRKRLSKQGTSPPASAMFQNICGNRYKNMTCCNRNHHYDSPPQKLPPWRTNTESATMIHPCRNCHHDSPMQRSPPAAQAPAAQAVDGHPATGGSRFALSSSCSVEQ